MNILRRLGLSLAVLLFSSSISLLVLFVSLHFVIDTPQPLKQALSASGIYNIAMQDSLAQKGNVSSALPITDPGVLQALKQAFPPSFVQTSSEQVIDGTYGWLQGKTATPNFSINLTQVKNNFANNIARYVQQKLEALPACPRIIAAPTTTEQLLALTCMPRGISAVNIANMARQEALGSKLFSENNTIDARSLKDAQGRQLTDQLTIIPKVHHYYILLLYLLPICILLCAAAIIFWSSTKRAGVKRLAWLLIGTGVTSMVLAVVEVWLLRAGATIFGMPPSTSPVIQDKLLAVLETLLVDLRVWWFGFGAGYTLLAIILFIALRFRQPKHTLAMGDGQVSHL